MSSYEETLVNITLDAAAGIAVNTAHTVPRGTATTVPAEASAAAGFQYRFVRVSGAHQCDLYTGAAGQRVAGVLQNKPQIEGHAATVAISGVTLIEANGAIAAGAGVGVGTGGRAVSGGNLGVAIHAAQEAGDLIPVLLRLPATAAA